MRNSEALYFGEQGAGQPLLLVHGLMVTGEMFEPVIGPFATRHRIIVPDLRGHGRSRNLPPSFSTAQLASDLARLLDRLGVESTAVLGYSQGGAIAQQFAIHHLGRCNRLVLACTYAYNMATLREAVEGRLAPLLIRVLGMRRFAKFVVSQCASDLDNRRAGWLVGLIADQESKLMVSAWKESMAFDSRRRLSEINCPTLIVAGSKDRAVPLHHAKMLHDGIAGSWLVVIEGAGHALIWTQPDALVRVTEEFLGP